MNPNKAEYVSRRMANARNMLDEVVEYHIENELWNTAVNRLYYACFYAVSALLYNYGFESKTHAGTQTLFGLHFIQTGIISKESGKFYNKLFSMRQNADYEDEVEYEKDDVIVLAEPANDLIAVVEAVLAKAD